jgi:predicted transposase YbfD/YdcC
VERTTAQLATAKRTQAVAYYLTNQEAATSPAQAELFTAIRGHWGCEADHWRRDVTWHEDQIRVTQPAQAHVLGVLRTLALRVFRRAGCTNFQALLDTLTDSPLQFTQLLCQVGLL